MSGKESLEKIAEQFLVVPLNECEKSERDFGTIIKKPNYFLKPMLHWLFTEELFKELNPDKQYVFSELIQKLNPDSATGMRSHEGEIYEIVRVIESAMVFEHCRVKPLRAGAHIGSTRQMYMKGQIFLAVDSDRHGANNLPFGFYHRLINDEKDISLSHILIIAEKQMAVKDGKIMKYGINRPPNSYKPTK